MIQREEYKPEFAANEIDEIIGGAAGGEKFNIVFLCMILRRI